MGKIELRNFLADPGSATPSAKIVRALSEKGALSGARLAQVTGLAKSTVSMTLAELRKSGIVVDSAGRRPDVGSVGRPGNTVTLNPETGTCVGILFGLQHIHVTIADVSHAVLAEKNFEIDPDYSPAYGAQVARGMMEEAFVGLGISRDTILGIGLALAAPVNPLDGKVLRAGGVPTWAGVDIRNEFESILGHQVLADNESNCSAIAEMMWGAAEGHQDFILFTVDLGVGGAIVHHGRVVGGIAGAAGEFGHMSIDPDGPLCRCGNRGCLELYASFRQPLAYASQRFGRQMKVREIVALALAGDTGCRRLIEDTADAAGRGLGIVGSVLNPGLVVISGGLAAAGDLFMHRLEASYDRNTLVKRNDVGGNAQTRFVRAKFDDNDACMGAVGLVLQHIGRPS